MITDEYARTLLNSVKEYRVRISIEDAKKLCVYERNINDIIESDILYVSEGKNLFLPLMPNEKEEFIDAAINEIVAIDSIKKELNKLEDN